MKRTRLCLTIATALLAAACQDRRAVTSPSAPLSADIEDANNGTIRNPHFFLLPPVVAQPNISETFNRGLSPVVRITEMDPPSGSDPTCHDGQIAFYTTTTGPGSTVVMDASNHQYRIVWQTKNFPKVAPPCVYRIQVELGGTVDRTGLVLGFADVQMVDNGAQLKNVDSDELVPLLDDRSLPFKFFIGPGAGFFAATGDNACRPGRDCGEAIVTGGQDATVLTEQQLTGVFIPGPALPLGEQIVVAIEQRTDRPCVPTFAMGLPQFNDCYRYVAFPLSSGSSDAPVVQRAATEGEFNPPFKFQQNVTVGMCVEVGNLTPAQTHFLDIFRFEPNPVEGISQLEALPNAPATFLPCDPNFQPGGSGGIGGILGRGWQIAMNGLHALLGPQRAYAASAVAHTGLGGGSCCLSYFTWGYPGILTPIGDTMFTVPSGSVIAPAPSVTVTDSGGAPIPGTIVTFAAAAGNGTVAGDVVTTGTDGIAQVGSWTLPLGTGVYTLTASVLGAANSPRHFIATVNPPDLIVQSLTHQPANPTTTDLITFTAVVQNIGTGSAGASHLEFRVGGETPGTPATRFAVPALAPGATFTVTRQLVLDVAQNYRNTATADVDNEVIESNETNNVTTDDYTVTAPIGWSDPSRPLDSGPVAVAVTVSPGATRLGSQH